PIIAHRVRMAALAGGRINFINPRAYEFLFPVNAEVITTYGAMASALAAVLKALAEISGKSMPANLAGAVTAVEVSEDARRIAQSLLDGKESAVLLGDLAETHPQFAELEALGAAIAALSGATYGRFSQGANSAGGWLTGFVPHRGAGGEPRATCWRRASRAPRAWAPGPSSTPGQAAPRSPHCHGPRPWSR